MALPRLGKRTTSVLSTVAIVVLTVAVWWLQSGDSGDTTASDPATTPASTSAPVTPSATTTAPEPSYETTTETATPPQDSTPATTAPPQDAMPEYDDHGLRYVALSDLPPEAAEVVALIDAGGPFPYEKDGSRFGNYEGILPDEYDGYYAEYTVETPGSPDRGARRIVRGDEGELYWTEDHYESFERIWR